MTADEINLNFAPALAPLRLLTFGPQGISVLLEQMFDKPAAVLSAAEDQHSADRIARTLATPTDVSPSVTDSKCFFCQQL
jgi:hypothetical protein